MAGVEKNQIPRRSVSRPLFSSAFEYVLGNIIYHHDAYATLHNVLQRGRTLPRRPVPGRTEEKQSSPVMWAVQAQEVSLGPPIIFFEAKALHETNGDTDKLQIEV